MASSAKQSTLDRLYKAFVDELHTQLKGSTDPETGERTAPNAALLAVIGQTLFRAGVKPTNDNPHHQKLARAYESLPFKVEDGEPNTDRKPN
jgi:hypothetical protein